MVVARRYERRGECVGLPASALLGRCGDASYFVHVIGLTETVIVLGITQAAFVTLPQDVVPVCRDLVVREVTGLTATATSAQGGAREEEGACSSEASLQMTRTYTGKRSPSVESTGNGSCRSCPILSTASDFMWCPPASTRTAPHSPTPNTHACNRNTPELTSTTTGNLHHRPSEGRAIGVPMLEMSSALRPLRCSSARPASLWSAAMRTLPSGSQSSTKFTPALHMLQTPSKRITGRLSSAK
eukprot:scaffold1607_cov417-Prasinococcus_capsulatus_cf.AAC.8